MLGLDWAANDTAQAASGNLPVSMRLRVEVENVGDTETVRLFANHRPIPQAGVQRPGENVFEASLSPESVKRGQNTLVVLPGPGSMGRLASVVTGASVSLVYGRRA